MVRAGPGRVGRCRKKVSDPAGIRAELDTYNPLIPDGSNWKVSCFIDFGEGKARRAAPRLRGVEHALWVQIAELKRIRAVADADLDPGDEERASAVHFLRFELDALQVAVTSGPPRTMSVRGTPAGPTVPPRSGRASRPGAGP